MINAVAVVFISILNYIIENCIFLFLFLILLLKIVFFIIVNSYANVRNKVCSLTLSPTYLIASYLLSNQKPAKYCLPQLMWNVLDSLLFMCHWTKKNIKGKTYQGSNSWIILSKRTTANNLLKKATVHAAARITKVSNDWTPRIPEEFIIAFWFIIVYLI